MSLCTERCGKCIHGEQISNNGKSQIKYCCQYIVHTGHSRHCPAGDECTEFEQKDGAKRRGDYGG